MSSTNPFTPDDLSDLWNETQKAERLHPQRPVMKAAKLSPPKRIDTLALFTDPKNWEARRGIALIHEESRSIIGNFREYVHKSSRGCRKLVRVDEPISIQATEYIHGWEHLGEEEKIRFAPVTSTHTQELVLEDLVLSALGVHATVTSVRAVLSYGGIIRVELLDHTQFTSPDGRVHLTLAAGLNVLEVMSLESKIALRKELSCAPS